MITNTPHVPVLLVVHDGRGFGSGEGHKLGAKGERRQPWVPHVDVEGQVFGPKPVLRVDVQHLRPLGRLDTIVTGASIWLLLHLLLVTYNEPQLNQNAFLPHMFL